MEQIPKPGTFSMIHISHMEEIGRNKLRICLRLTESVAEPSIESRFLLNSSVGLFSVLYHLIFICYKQMLIIYH